MNDGILMLVIGLVAGGAAASVIWALVVFGKAKKLQKEKNEREQVVLSVSELLAEADTIEANFRSGALAQDNFRRSLSDKSGAIKRLLRTNMHILDVFFVKYAEQQANEYLRMIDNPERRKTEAEFDAPPAVPAVFGDTADFPEETIMDGRVGAKKPLVAAAPESAIPASVPPPIKTEEQPAADIDTFDTPEKQEPATPAAVVKEELADTDITDELEPFVKTPVAEEPKPAPAVVAEKPAIEEDVFDLPAAAPATPAPVSTPAVPDAESDAWSDPSIEEFEAAFAQFEEQVTPPPPITKAPPAPEPEPAVVQQPEPPKVAESTTGITGDDVGDAIDNMFNLK
jgi:hypothetical protein